MLMTNRLFWAHPQGHGFNIPCVHLIPQHPNDPVAVRYTVTVQEHPGATHHEEVPIPGRPKVPIPCTHLKQETRTENVNVPCVHLAPRHQSDGDFTVPCTHALPVVARRDDLGIVFYTDNTFIQNETVKAVEKLKGLGVPMSSANRPLRVLNRPFLEGHPENSENPFWSHYDPASHSIQITRRPQATNAEVLDTLHHELGHATLGHTCVQITSPGGAHSIDKPSHPPVAMSEGWAHFVALVLRFNDNETPTQYRGRNWEARSFAVPKDPNIEYNVGCTLWDLFDSNSEGFTAPSLGGFVVAAVAHESVKLSFDKLFEVYSPTLATLVNGPLIPGLDSYLQRLIQNNPTHGPEILRARRHNCG